LEWALVQRINYRLKRESEVLKKTRGQAARARLGDFYVLDRLGNCVIQSAVDLEAFGRDLHVLRPWEIVEAQE
jgi:hypothetical protein